VFNIFEGTLGRGSVENRMKSHVDYFLVAVCVVALDSLCCQAATIWFGATTNFENFTSSDQDQLTTNVWITRGAFQGIWNAAKEGGFTAFFSPQDTEWADGALADYASLSYTNWNAWAKFQHGGPPSTIGVNAIVHLITDDIYLSVTFTDWGIRMGGFSYTRSTPPVANQPPTVAITSPANGASFIAPANVPITATASDPDGSVTNVAFFDGTTFLGRTNDLPYTVAVHLAAGAHPLTAVATDNGGLSTTSSVLNVTVSARLTIQLMGDMVDISWPDAGGRLQSKTNILSPAWVDVPTSTTTNRIVIPINPDGSEGVFYRLAVP
jgi:hypothetical protein